MRVRGKGYFTSASATPCTFGLRAGNGMMLATNILALATSIANDYMEFDIAISVRSTGASGVCFPAGSITYPSTSGGASAITQRRMQNGATAASTVTIDTTSPILLDFFITPGATTHGFTIMQCSADFIP